MKDQVIIGSTFSGPISDVKIQFTKEMINEYIPVWEKVTENENKGLAFLILIMAHKEGFKKGTRSYRFNNPGNIGNTDSGENKALKTLEEGIKLQVDYVKRVASGKHKAFPLNKSMFIKPFYSKEIAENQKVYGNRSPWVPGYKFIYTGKLEQFVKIYSTGARSGNSYLSLIISYFKNMKYEITPETTIQEIITLK